MTRIILKKGFTLVEMMVAIAVFSVVMVVAMGAMLNVIDADQKAQSIKTAVDNINFAIESISKDMRVGTDYACGSDSEPNGDCTGAGGNIIKYKSVKSVRTDGSRGYVYYRFYDNDGTGVIQQCIEQGDNTCNYAGPFSDITSPEVNITAMRFYVIGTSAYGSEKRQPRVVITLSGLAGTKQKTQTVFDMQTSISQRTRTNN